MKKNLIFVLLLMLLLLGCARKENKKISVLSPMGTPALSQMYIENDKDKYNYDIDIVQGSDALNAAFVSKTYDFIYAPINLGAKMYLNNKNYKLLAVTVNLNYYFVSKYDELDFENKNIVLFGKNAPSGIFSEMYLNNVPNHGTIEYVNSVADSLSQLILDNNKIVLLSEPQISIAESKIDGLHMYSLKTLLEKENILLPQAGVFVKSDLESKYVDEYLERLNDSVYKVNNNIEESASVGSTLYNNFTKEALLNAIARSEIVFLTSNRMIEECDDFFTILNGVDSKIIGGEIDETFYYKK